MSIIDSSGNTFIFNFNDMFTLKKTHANFESSENLVKRFYYGNNYKDKLAMLIRYIKIEIQQSQISDFSSLKNEEKWCDMSSKTKKILYCGYIGMRPTPNSNNSQYPCPLKEEGNKENAREGYGSRKIIFVILLVLLILSSSYNIYMMVTRKPVPIDD
ncbi:hypothetical protein RF11_03222 [Thelohanellus kitauei]|uniref:Uncharacterized protein n=1 Tax=Thelohanellus kitauei TaxID=669202 RepID=A0A0C2MR53_THEKT|nr:hypothetical protein RF11_03222 [Thelohanellus kitauei]